MVVDEKYMHRCIQLALHGKGNTAPNPMVGAVIVSNNKIIGEGYHRQYGNPHAEVNAINSVKDKSLLKDSTIYVSLEPCSHYGKTPPCAQLIIDSQIPRVVIGCLDPYPKVSGRGVEMLRQAGIEVITGVLNKDVSALNKEFFNAQLKNRPYIYLKWAQSRDGFIDRLRTNEKDIKPTIISNSYTQMLVHKKRSEVQAIMIGTNTALKDNPSLTTRLWNGKNPVRVILDRQNRIPKDYTIFDGKVETLIFTEAITHENEINNVTYIPINFDDDLLSNIFFELNRRKINSVLVEGGRVLLQSLIDNGLWDEAFIETGYIDIGKGILAPKIHADAEIETISRNKYGYSVRVTNLRISN